MSTEAAAADTAAIFQLQDIALWDCSFTRVVEYQPGLHDLTSRIQSRRGTTADLLEATDNQGNSVDYLRVIVRFALRVVAIDDPSPDGQPEDVKPEEVLHEIEAGFAVHYQLAQTPDEQTLKEFVAFNCVHNAWPFWRQHVYDTLKRASLPLIEIPLFSGRTRAAELPRD